MELPGPGTPLFVVSQVYCITCLFECHMNFNKNELESRIIVRILTSNWDQNYVETLRQSVSLNLQQIGDTINPLDDHELLLWAMRAGLTRDEMHRGRAHPLATYRGDGLIPKGDEAAHTFAIEVRQHHYSGFEKEQ